MSHITKYELKVTDTDTLKSALESLQEQGQLHFTWLGKGTERTYSKSTTGTHFKLEGWSYPICVTEDGSLEFDNYNGNWGSESLLDKVIQCYQQKVISNRARKQGWQVHSTQEANGDLVLRLMQ